VIDAVLRRLAPGLAAARAQSRLELATAEAARAQVQAYAAAQIGGRHAGWRRTHESADAANYGALPWLRASARDLVRNDPHANRAVRVIVAHVAGTGVRPRPDVEEGAGALARAARDQWRRFADNCDPEGRTDWYGQQRLLTRSVVESGEALRVWTAIEDRGRLFWRCRVLEADWLDHSRDGELPAGGRIVQGVEFDAIGRRVAYWMHDRHPGDRFSIGTRFGSRRISAEFVDHVYERLRPGQARGVSWFAPVAVPLRDLADLAEAELVRKKLEACISMVVHNANEDGGVGGAALAAVDGPGGAPMTTAAGAPIERMQPGMVLQARPGWTVDFMAAPPSQGLAEHMRERLHAIAAGVGVTYHQMTGDLSQANYSSLRGGQVEFERLVDAWQDELMIHQTGRPAWRRVMEAALAQREVLRIPRAAWVRPRRPWVDPQKEANAARLNVEAGFESPSDVIERMGEDPEARLDEIARWRDAAEARGLKLWPDYSRGSDGQTPAEEDEDDAEG